MIANALDLLTKSRAALSLWNGILAPEKPDLAVVASWGREALDRYHQASLVRGRKEPEDGATNQLSDESNHGPEP